ncbi:MAG: hydroxymethylglutaryl-CoA lyase [Flavobacteriales bacterium]|jgi:hydroxymethylglutaryl-CoA lyase
MNLEKIKVIECPRDAMQGMKTFVPTQTKIDHINQLLKVGFDTIDFGSFVSEKAIPQMRDTREVLAGLDLSNTKSKLLAIIANVRGAEDACAYEEIRYLGFPFSISETFQMRNTNSTIEQSLERVAEIQELCIRNKKELVIYISMGFGNPYGDLYSPDIAKDWSYRLHTELGVNILALSDTIGAASPSIISELFSELIPALPNVEFGAHLHTTPSTWFEKVDAAYKAGCKRFDGALHGLGGCPMAKDELTGNMPTENIIAYFKEKNLLSEIDMVEFRKAMAGRLEVGS